LAPFVACELSREGNRLYARVTGQARHRLFAAEADTFEWRVVAARVHFLRNESGQVDSLEILQDGQVVPGKRYVGE